MRQEERRARTFKALVEAAAASFATAGYDGASLDAIAASAGLTKGAIYAHFQTKLQLFLVIAEMSLSEALDRTRAVAGAVQRGDDLVEAAHGYLAGEVGPRQLAIMSEIWRLAASVPNVRERLEAFRDERVAILGQAAVEGGLPPSAALRRAEMIARLIDGETLERRLAYAAGS